MTNEEKEELIALSDLNREDNIKYISSEAQGIAITLDSDRYAPTFCKLERAYICGRRKSEKRIEELENKIADIKANCDLAIEGRDIKIKELEEENERLKAELKNWKDEWQEQVQKAIDEGYARTLQTLQLTKATDHIKQLLDCLKQDTNDPETNYYVCQYMDKAEQFIKEIEK